MNKQVTNISLKNYIKNFFLDKISVSICCISLLTLITSYFVVFKKESLAIFPDHNNYQIDFYTDSAEMGNSSVERFISTDSVIKMDFILRKGFVRPYVGIDLMNLGEKEIDISHYNQVQIEASGIDFNNIVICLITNDSNIAKISRKFPFQYYCDNIEITPEKKLFKMYLDQFKVPDWWFDVNNLSPSVNKMPNWKRLVGLNISVGLAPTLDTTKTLNIYSLTMKKDNTLTIFYMFVVQVIVLIILFLLFVFKHKPFWKSPLITINYKAVSLNDNLKQDHSFLDYIHNNFQDSELSLKKVSNATNVHSRHIAETIANQYGCNFKTYINLIRINESKRLLKETNLQISEIAFKVGYSSPNHFNRVFKNLTGKNPSEFMQSIDV